MVRITFTPENVMDIQRTIGADIIVAFDECTPTLVLLLQKFYTWAPLVGFVAIGWLVQTNMVDQTLSIVQEVCIKI